MEAADRDHGIDALRSERALEHAAAHGRSRQALQGQPVLHHRDRPPGDVQAGVPRTRRRELLTDRPVPEPDLENPPPGPGRRIDVAQEVRIEREVCLVEAFQGFQ